MVLCSSRGGHGNGEEGTQGRADPARIAPGGERHAGGRHLPRARDQRSDLLHLEEEVFGTGPERAARAPAVARGELRNSSGWSRISRWTGTSCRRSCKKSCKASSSTRAWALDADRLRAEHAAGVGADDDQSIDHELPEPARSAARAANADARAGGEPGALRLSTPDGDAADAKAGR